VLTYPARYNYIPSLSQLTISGMPTHLRNALIDFSRVLFRQLDSHQQCIFTPSELKKIFPTTANIPLPGVTHRLATTSATRTIQSAYEKIPDFALNYNDRIFPQVVFEVGWAIEKNHTAKYAEGIEDAKDWLVATKGRVSIVWLIQAVEGPVVGSFATAVERLIRSEEVSLDREPHKEAEGITPGSDDSMELSDSENNPDNSIDTIGTEETSQSPTTDRNNTSGAGMCSQPGDSDSSTASSTASSYSTIYETMAPILSNWIGPLTVFLEGYSYDPTTDGIRCSHPRVYLLRNNIPENPLPTLPLSRDHFGMRKCQNEGYGEVFQVGLEEYVGVLQRGRVKDGYVRKVRIKRMIREEKRKRSGGDPADGDWLPHRAEGTAGGEEEASTSGKVRWNAGVKGEEMGFKRRRVG